MLYKLPPAEFGRRFIESKYGRPYRYKNRKARTNFRSGTKRKFTIYQKNKNLTIMKKVNAPQVDGSAESKTKDIVEEINKMAGYNLPLAYAALEAAVVNEEKYMKFSRLKAKVDIAAIADVVVRARGNKVDSDTLATLMNTAVAYGWHWAMENESLLRSTAVLDEICEFVDSTEKLTKAQREERKKAIALGFSALTKATERMLARIKSVRQMQIKK